MLPEGWTVCRLGDLFESRKERGRIGLPILSVTMKDGLVDRQDLDRKQDTAISPAEHLLVRPGDIAYNTMRMWQGAFGLSDREGMVSPAYVVLKPKCNVEPAFLTQLLRTPRMLHLLWAYSYGLTDDRLRLYFDDFAAIPVAVPGLQFQQQLAAGLALWDRTADTLEKLAANARAEKRALLHRLLPTPTQHASSGEQSTGWQLVRLGDVVDVNPRRPEMPDDGRVTFLPMEAVSEQGRFDASRVRQYVDVCAGYTGFKDGDLLVAKITPCFENGKGALLTNLTNGTGFGSTEFHVLRPTGLVEPGLIAQVLQSSEFRRRGAAEMEGSAGQKRISADFIKSFKFLCPKDKPRQRAIRDLLDTADQIVNALDLARDGVLREKQALLQHVVAQPVLSERT